jgi:hypothetical protein
MMSVFLVLLLLYLFLKILTSGQRIYWFLFSITLVLNAFTDYLPSLIIIVFWVYALIIKKNMLWRKRFLLAHLPLIILFLFWISVFLKQIQLGLSVRDGGSLWWNVLGRTDIKNLLLVPVKFIFGRISFFDKNFYFAISVFVLSVYCLIIYKGRKKLVANKYYNFLILWLFIPVVLSAVAGLKISVFSYFRLIFVLPAFYIILALSVVNLSKKWRFLAISFVFTISILSSFYYLLTPRFHRENWRGLVNYIREESEGSGYGIIFASVGQREGFKYYSNTNRVVNNKEINPNLQRIWYVRYVQDIFDPGDSVRKRIETTGFKRKNVHDFNGIIVWEYENSN